MIWATINTWFFFFWLYRASPSSTAKNIINLISVPTIWCCPYAESALRMRWPNYWSFSFSIIPSKEYPGLISFRMDWLDLLAAPSSSNTREDSTQGHHQMVNTEIRLIILFAAKDGEALYSQQKQDRELTVAQIMNSLLPNSDLNWRK